MLRGGNNGGEFFVWKEPAQRTHINQFIFKLTFLESFYIKCFFISFYRIIFLFAYYFLKMLKYHLPHHPMVNKSNNFVNFKFVVFLIKLKYEKK